jgi:hypothetical protein
MTLKEETFVNKFTHLKAGRFSEYARGTDMMHSQDDWFPVQPNVVLVH